jgi:hypothetical protein
MLYGMDLSQINYLAVVAASLSAFVIGFFWYAPFLFGKVWMKEAGLSKEKVRQASMIKIFSLAFLLSLIICFNLAVFLGSEAGLAWGMIAGGLAGIGWVTASMGIQYLYEGRSFKLFLINGGYQAVSYITAGAIIGVWQ